MFAVNETARTLAAFSRETRANWAANSPAPARKSPSFPLCARRRAMSRRAPVGKTGIAYRMNILLTANGAPGEITLARAAEYLAGARVLRAYDRARARARVRPVRAERFF